MICLREGQVGVSLQEQLGLVVLTTLLQFVEKPGVPGRVMDVTSCPHRLSDCLSRKKKKILKEQRKRRERVELKMDLPGVSIADEGETGMFSLKTIGKTKVGTLAV